MKTRRAEWVIAAAAAFALILGIATSLFGFFGARHAAEPSAGSPGGRSASLFEVELRNTEGVDVKLGDYRGDVLVVNFWATWCFPCRLEIPDFIEFTKRYKDRGVRILGIAIDESGPEAVKSFARDIGINYPVLIGDPAVTTAFGGVLGFPTTFLLSRDGRIYSHYTGLAPKAQIEQDIEYLLTERTT